jgi:hypothetical protein
MDAKSPKHEKDRPSKAAFKQQRLATWQPVLSPMYVVGCFIAIAAAFIPIGAAVLIATGNIVEVEVPYSDPVCTWGSSPKMVETFPVNNNTYKVALGCTKTITFTVPRKIEKPVYMYYKLSNFYQNYRRYLNSKSDMQIRGESLPKGDIESLCGPRTTTGDTKDEYTQQKGVFVEYMYNPCGMQPWAMFNDSATLYSVNAAGVSTLICDTALFSKLNNSALPNTKMNCEKVGISWESDRDGKYKEPEAEPKIPAKKPDDIIDAVTYNGIKDSQDYYVRNGYYNGEAGHKIPNTMDEDLMVWMRTASLPTFRKLWRKINIDLDVGVYKLVISDRYDISAFSGQKYVLLTSPSWIGGKNEFLGVAYIAIGALCFVFGVAFFAKHKYEGGRAT